MLVGMLNYDLNAVADEMKGKAWREFLRVPSMSMGVYRLKVGEVDRQSPHTEDEVYYVIEGRSKFVAGEKTMEAKAGMVLFVERLVAHRFFDITEDLTLLVFFSPAENSARGSRLSHINVTMPKGKEDEARAFYGGLLGLMEVPKPEPLRVRGGVWFDAGGLDLHVSVEEDRTGADQRRHFGLECGDVMGVRAKLEAAGIAVDEGRPTPWKRFFVLDPFGNRIEIHEVGGLRMG